MSYKVTTQGKYFVKGTAEGGVYEDQKFVLDKHYTGAELNGWKCVGAQVAVKNTSTGYVKIWEMGQTMRYKLTKPTKKKKKSKKKKKVK